MRVFLPAHPWVKEVPAIAPLTNHAPVRSARPHRGARAGWLLAALTLGSCCLPIASDSDPTRLQDAPPAAPATPQGIAPALPTDPALTGPTHLQGTPIPAPTLPKPLAPPTIKATSAILIDAVSGQVLFEQNADARRPIASTTKIMTALLFCENVPDDAIVKASACACKTKESSAHLKPGEMLTAHDLLRAILLRSANDACVAAAEHIAGTEAAFVDLMNARAAQLGVTHTHFVNSHGLHNPQHYASARDLAIIARAAIQEPRFNEVVRTERCRIQRSLNTTDVAMTNHSHFLTRFPGADGIKTGWTVPAGHCFVGSASYGNWRLISVVLHSPDYVHETSTLMRYGFSNFERHVVAHAGDPVGPCAVEAGVNPSVAATVKQQVQVITRKGEHPQIETHLQFLPVAAPVTAGMVVGTIAAWVDGKPLCTSPLIAQEADAATPLLAQKASVGGRWKSMMFGAFLLATGLVSLRHGTHVAALTKSTCRRWRRLAKSLRGVDAGRQGHRQRAHRPRTRYPS